MAKLTCFKPNIIQLCHLISKLDQKGGAPNKDLLQLTGVFEKDKRMIKLMLIKWERMVDLMKKLLQCNLRMKKFKI